MVFILIMVLLMRRAPLGPVMLGGSVLLAILYRTSPGAFLGMVWRATQNPATIELLAILTSIMLLEHLLGKEGYLEKMLKGLRGLFQDRRVIMALIPAFIGLMPSAGGAIFSAPLVGQAAASGGIAAEEKSFVNYYYRHIWEYFLPLYPGVLLASRLSGLPLPHLITALAPYGLLVVLLGLPILWRLPPLKEEEEGPGERLIRAKEFFTGTLPILVVLALSLIAQIEVGLAVGTVVAVLLIRHRYNPSKLWHLCREAITVKTLVLVWGIMVFKQVLVDTKAVESLPPLLGRLPVPGFLVFGFLSFLVGMLTGLMAAFVGITFPLITASMGDQLGLPLVVFVFIAGFTGTMLSPLHLCLVLTVDFFKADVRKVFRLLVGPEIALMTIALLGYLFRI
ncbi:DUF401 family protein [Thermanaeromonas toyohensis]|uniref:DUF401 family protein n=1 Tax=Thermanaeromonas toyohensis TaxID=161154 RepID=UPI0022B255F5|nr:DUF401 family protein [Thermanaeromonas toyohensis]